MKRLVLLFAAAVVACGGSETRPGNVVSKEPVSVRGWIQDVEGAQHSTNPDMESARLSQLFQATQIWVEGAEYVSGGVAPNGAFILLDVPPGNATIGFSAPGAEQARLVLQNIPGNADVMIPAIILKANGSTIADPKAIKVRVPANIAKAQPEGKNAIVGGAQVVVVDVPLAQLVDRHDYPQPAGFRPVATYK